MCFFSNLIDFGIVVRGLTSGKWFTKLQLVCTQNGAIVNWIIHI